MDLGRSWGRKIVQATGAGVVAPAAIVAAAIAVGVGGGGIRGLGSLSQTLHGPEIPNAEAADPAPSPSAHEDLLERSARRESAAERAARTASERRAAEQRLLRRRARARGEVQARPERTPSPGGTRPTRPSPTPPPGPTTEPTTLRQVGDEIKETTDPIPVAGEPAGVVVDTIVETADEVLPVRLPIGP